MSIEPPSKKNVPGRIIALSIALLTVLVAAYWAEKMWFDRPLMTSPEARDVFSSYLPNMQYAIDRVRTGGLPLWNPYEFVGMPHAATLEYGPFYPLTPLYALGRIHNAHLLSGLTHLVFFGIFSFLFFRVSLRVHPSAAMFGAIVVVFSGWTASRALAYPDAFRSAVFIPLVFVFADRLTKQPNALHVTALACAFALQFLAGETEIVVRTGLFLLPFVLMRLYQSARDGARVPQLGRTVAGFIAAGVCALGLAAVQLIPTIELALHGVRSPDGLTFAQAASPIDGGIVWAPVLFRALVSDADAPNIYYVGALPLVLALYAFARRRSETWFFALAALLLFTLVLGTGTPLYRLYYNLPTGDWFRFPLRFQVFLLVSVAALTALGMDALIRDVRELRRPPVRYRLLLFLAAALAIALNWHDYSDRFEAAVSVITLGGVTVCIIAALVTKRVQVAAIAALIVIVVGQLTPVYVQFDLKPYNSPRDLDLVGIPDAFDDAMRADLEPGERVYVDYALWDGRHVPKFGLLTGVPAVNGFSPFMPKAYWDLVEPYRLSRLRRVPADVGVPLGLPGGLSHASGATEFLQVTGVRTVLLGLGSEFHPGDAPGRSTPPSGYTTVLESDRWTLIETPNPLPRAFLVSQTFNGRSVRDLFGAVIAPCRITEYTPSRIVVSIPDATDAVLVLTDQHYPGWRAYVDGEVRDIRPVAGIFRGVRIGEGSGEVVFQYRPNSLRVGMVITIYTLCVAVFVLYLPTLRRHTAARKQAPRS